MRDFRAPLPTFVGYTPGAFLLFICLTQFDALLHLAEKNPNYYTATMLTKSDVTQIRNVIREELENEVRALKDELQADITMSRMRLQEDIGELKDRIKNLELRVTKMHKELKEEIKLVSLVLDKDNMKTQKRVERIEDHLGLAQA